ncbi:MAG: hypothetical protein VKJ04_06520 [Vampirovibrionales bacterium]|nr:hypothetical protein [Vampirovibrionales bacterium]
MQPLRMLSVLTPPVTLSARRIPAPRAAMDSVTTTTNVVSTAPGKGSLGRRLQEYLRRTGSRFLDVISGPDTKVYSNVVQAPRSYGQIKAGAAAMGRPTY